MVCYCCIIHDTKKKSVYTICKQHWIWSQSNTFANFINYISDCYERTTGSETPELYISYTPIRWQKHTQPCIWIIYVVLFWKIKVYLIWGILRTHLCLISGQMKYEFQYQQDIEKQIFTENYICHAMWCFGVCSKLGIIIVCVDICGYDI